MTQSWRYMLLCTSLLALAFLAVSFGQRSFKPASASLPLDDWDIPELAAYLERAGLGLRLVPVPQNGFIYNSVFLTNVERDWTSLNRLSKDPERIHLWRGVLYCERVGRRDPSILAGQWGEHCLVAGPFIFYGDGELLVRVRDALAHPVSAAL